MANLESQDDEFSIAIIGMDGRFPGARDLNQFWDNLVRGKETANCQIEDFELFDPVLFGYSKAEADLIDPQQRLMLESAYTVMTQAGYSNNTVAHNCGVFCGAGFNQYLFTNLSHFMQSNYSSAKLAMLLHANSNDYLANRIAYKLNLIGPALTIQTACSTSLVAVHVACLNLLTYQCDMALAGGVSLLLSEENLIDEQGGMLSPDHQCRAFDAEANGTVFASGYGMVLLKRLTDAIEDKDRIYAVIKGSAVNNDGLEKVGFTAPSTSGQSKVIQEALKNANVNPKTIGYIEAHGTATALGDYIEFCALHEIFKPYISQGKCPIGSVKANTGHLLAAAGITGLLKTVLAMNYRKLPPSINYKSPNPNINFDDSYFYVNNVLSDWKNIEPNFPLRAGISSFGIGGTNAHLILEESPSRTNQFNNDITKPIFKHQRCWIESEKKQQEAPSLTPNITIQQNNSILATLSQIWQEILGVDHIKPEDDFFEMGGHSLLGTQMASRIKEHYPIKFDADDLYQYSILQDLAKQIESLLIEKIESMSDVEANIWLEKLDIKD